MAEVPTYQVRARAPLRIDLAGGGTDVVPFAAARGGVALAAAVSLSVHVEIQLGGRTIRLRAEDRDQHATLGNPSAIAYDGRLDRPKAALNMLPVTGGLEILTRSDAPSGSGLGARGALNVALLAALAQCRNQTFDATELADLAFQLEKGELDHPLATRQDPYIAALGGVHELRFGAETVAARHLPLDDQVLAELRVHLVVAHFGRSYPADAAARRVFDAHAQGDAGVADALIGLRDLVEPVRAALEVGDWRRLGELFDESARHHGALDPAWCAPPTSSSIQAARAAGAWGVKPAGPRPGAALVILGPSERRDAIAAAVHSCGGGVLDCQVGMAPGVTVWREEVAEA